ncbi:MAG TPA: hypothetical protein DCY53_01280 [Desulfobacteraceae bacterium]|nr:hypothetical protein [Desulfobacteraceae bacterium]
MLKLFIIKLSVCYYRIKTSFLRCQRMAKGAACQENIKHPTYQNDAPLWLDKGCFAIVVI